jgi:restriction endonuclease Mrr
MSHFPSSTLPPPCSSPKFPLPWEPALTQLRELSPPELDQLVATWLSALGLSAPRVRERRPGITTYQATLGKPPFSTPVQIRIYQRQNRLQVHHVDAFVGYLTRVGVPSGLLITTGDCSHHARLIAGGVQSRRVRLLSGAEWAMELASARAGVKRRRLWGWIVDLRRRLDGVGTERKSTPGRR